MNQLIAKVPATAGEQQARCNLWMQVDRGYRHRLVPHGAEQLEVVRGPNVINDATDALWCAVHPRRGAGVTIEAAMPAISAQYKLDAEQAQEVEDLLGEWEWEAKQDRAERVAECEDSKSEPLDPHGPWGAP